MNEKQYNNNIKKISKLMSLESKVNIVGSAKIRRNLYYSDYDSFETVKGMNENMIYNHFMSVFEIIRIQKIQLLLISNYRRVQRKSPKMGLRSNYKKRK
jgi:hypothetical protein